MQRLPLFGSSDASDTFFDLEYDDEHSESLAETVRARLVPWQLGSDPDKSQVSAI